jgi:hypothetical protein
VWRAYTRTQLLDGRVPPDPWSRRVLLSFHRERGGDVEVLYEPYWMSGTSGTTHGTPFSYDTHIPLLVMGRGIRPGRHDRPVVLNDLAPTLATLLGIETPSRANRAAYVRDVDNMAKLAKEKVMPSFYASYSMTVATEEIRKAINDIIWELRGYGAVIDPAAIEIGQDVGPKNEQPVFAYTVCRDLRWDVQKVDIVSAFRCSRSSSITWRWDRMTFLVRRSASRTFRRSERPTKRSRLRTSRVPTWEAGTKPGTPQSTRRPPLTRSVTMASTNSPPRAASSSRKARHTQSR